MEWYFSIFFLWGRLSLLCLYYYERLSVNTTDMWARRKNSNPPNFVTAKPFVNYFRKYKTDSSFDFIFAKINKFSMFTFERSLNHRKMCLVSSSLREWKRKLIPWGFFSHKITLWSFYCIYTLLQFQKISIWLFYFIFFKLPSKSILSRPSILGCQ